MADEPTEEPIIAYKRLLADIIDNRPSGTRQRLAAALGKNRSFVTQITSPSYSTPLPARHLPAIFGVCHFSPAEQERFVAAYQLAHPGKTFDSGSGAALRHVSLMVPDLENDAKNRQIDDAIAEFAHRIINIVRKAD